MLYMLLVKASKNSEQGLLPSAALRASMDRYLDELDAAGVLVMAKGLAPSREAVRLSFMTEGADPVVTKGPFFPAEDVIAGFFCLRSLPKKKPSGGPGKLRIRKDAEKAVLNFER